MSLSTTSKQFLNTLRDGDSTTSLGEPIPVLNNPFCIEVFPDIQPKLTLVQLEAISLILSPVISEKRPTPLSQ